MGRAQAREIPFGTSVALRDAMKSWHLVWAFAMVGCGARSDIEGPPAPGPSGCIGTPIACVARNASDPCGAPSEVDGICDGNAWVCPASARPYARAISSGTCLPFSDPSLGIRESGEWGLSSIVRVPTEDGRCLWNVEDVKFADGSETRNIAFEPDLDAPFGTCPTTSKSKPAPIVRMEDGDDPTLLVQIASAYRLAGKSRALYRLFRVDPNAVFGVTELGGGIAHWENGQIVI